MAHAVRNTPGVVAGNTTGAFRSLITATRDGAHRLMRALTGTTAAEMKDMKHLWDDEDKKDPNNDSPSKDIKFS